LTTYRETAKLESVITYLGYQETKKAFCEILRKRRADREISAETVLENWTQTLKKVAGVIEEIEGAP
jgi:hypothetical protein